MATKPQPATRIRTCRACGKQYEYPIKGSNATRHHCEECVEVPAHLRRVAERLFSRVQMLETTVKRMEKKLAATAPAPIPSPVNCTPIPGASASVPSSAATSEHSPVL